MGDEKVRPGMNTSTRAATTNLRNEEDIPIGFEFDAAPDDGTNDCDFTTTPSGMHSVVCRFDGS